MKLIWDFNNPKKLIESSINQKAHSKKNWKLEKLIDFLTIQRALMKIWNTQKS